MKKFIAKEFLAFTKKGCLISLLICAVVTFLISTKVNFSTNLALGVISLCVEIVFFVILYPIFTLISYFYIPKCPKKHIGVLFFIDTKVPNHYDSIREKLICNFKELAAKYGIRYEAVILSQKKVSVIKNIERNENQEKLVDRANCVMCVLIRAQNISSEEGNSDYELKLVAGTKHKPMRRELQNILAKSLYLASKDMVTTFVSAKQELPQLKERGDHIFYLCHFIFATSMYFSLNIKLAYKLYKELNSFLPLIKANNSLYNTLKYYGGIWLFEIGDILYQEQYRNYINEKGFDACLVEDIINVQDSLIKNVKDPLDSWIQNFHMIRAVYYVVAKNDFRKAKEEIDELNKKYPKARWKSSWGFSYAFIDAHENKNLWKIEKNYQRLAQNLSVNIVEIVAFIETYLKADDNLGLHIALYTIYKTRSDLKDMQRLLEIKKEILERLKKDKGFDKYMKHIEQS